MEDGSRWECGVNPVLVFLSRIIYLGGSLYIRCVEIFFLLKNFSYENFFSFVARVIKDKRLFLEVLISFCTCFCLNPFFKVRRFFKLNTFFV